MVQELAQTSKTYKSMAAASAAARLMNTEEGVTATPVKQGNAFTVVFEKTGESIPETTRPSRMEGGVRERRKRKPLEERNILDCEPRPGYVRRWVLDNQDLGGTRLQNCYDIDWDFVYADGKERPSESEGDVGRASQLGSLRTRPSGRGGTLYLMEKREEWYDEDQREKQKKVDEIEQQLQSQPPAESGLTPGDRMHNVKIGRRAKLADV